MHSSLVIVMFFFWKSKLSASRPCRLQLYFSPGVKRVPVEKTRPEHPVGGDTCDVLEQAEEQFSSSGDALSGGRDGDATGAKESSCVDEPRRRENPSPEEARADTAEGDDQDDKPMFLNESLELECPPAPLMAHVKHPFDHRLHVVYVNL